MNKTELVETISQRTDIAKKDVQAVLDTFEDIAGEIVAKGKDTLTIPGFQVRADAPGGPHRSQPRRPARPSRSRRPTPPRCPPAPSSRTAPRPAGSAVRPPGRPLAEDPLVSDGAALSGRLCRAPVRVGGRFPAMTKLEIGDKAPRSD